MAGDSSDEILARAYQVGASATATAPAPNAQPIPGRLGAIRALGVIQIVLGGICSLMALAVFLGSTNGSPLAIAYSPAAANLLITGIASVSILPWARRATIGSAVLWLVLAGVGIAALVHGAMTGSSFGMGRAELSLVGVILIPVALVMIGLPITLIVVYTRPSVRAAFESRRAQADRGRPDLVRE